MTEIPPRASSQVTEGQNPHEREPVGVYAVGRIQARFPDMSVEKEFLQVAAQHARSDTGLSRHEALHSVLASRHNHYLARELIWILAVAGVDVYILRLRDPRDMDLLVDAIEPSQSESDVDVVIGTLGSYVPLVGEEHMRTLWVDNIYSFDRQDLFSAVPIRDNESHNSAAASEVFTRLTQLADNAGATDDHRALNYLAVRHPGIYHRTAEQYSENAHLSAVRVTPSRLSSPRSRVVDVILDYTYWDTNVVKSWFVRVDVTGKYPFVVSELQPFWDR